MDTCRVCLRATDLLESDLCAPCDAELEEQLARMNGGTPPARRRRRPSPAGWHPPEPPVPWNIEPDEQPILLDYQLEFDEIRQIMADLDICDRPELAARIKSVARAAGSSDTRRALLALAAAATKFAVRLR